MTALSVRAIEDVLAGRGEVRPAEDSDAVDRHRPRLVVEPHAPDALADVLGACARERMRVVLRGAGTKLDWRRRGGPVDVVMSTRRLTRLVAHRFGDLTATMEAGMPVADLNRELARHGQWLPIDPSFEGATVGGTIAANDSGPLRQRYGSARDLLLGVQLATADGRLVKSGSNVVKNVAGYDLGKLMSGSAGAIAAIATATFKLAPLPKASATLGAEFATGAALCEAVQTIGASQLEPLAFEVHLFVPPASTSAARTVHHQLLVRFAGMPEVVESQLVATERILVPARTQRFDGIQEDDVWREHRRLIWAPPGAVARVSWLPASLSTLLGVVDSIAGSGASVAVAGRAGMGAGLIRVDGTPKDQIAAIEQLRAHPHALGNVVPLRADGEVRDALEAATPPSDASPLIEAVKRSLDPAGVLV